MAVSMKKLSLFVLVIQTTAHVLLLRYSRTSSPQNGLRYLSSTAVVVAEVIKLLVSVAIIFVEKGYSLPNLVDLLRNEVVFKPRETGKLMIPSGLYTIQNNLLFLALSNLDAATYQVTYQMKILTTALFSVLMLGKQLTPLKWFSLLILMAGVALVQMPTGSQPAKSTGSDGAQLVGLLAVSCACFSSGFAGVYFEKILKGSSQSLWIRNVQLALIGIGTGLLGVLLSDYQKVITDGFFQGYNQLTWIVVLSQAFGGLVVAMVVKYADNILKGFAASLSIVFSTLLSTFVLHEFTPSGFFYLGSTAVIGATMLYGSNWRPSVAS